MKKLVLLLASIALIGCIEQSQSKSSDGSDGKRNNQGDIADWQASTLGQEGHGGDAIVCFSIPVERALYQQKFGHENTCQPGEPCQGHNSSEPNSPSSGIVWRMTEDGRKSIRSAKPLEQYLAEGISSKKVIIDQLNQMPLEDGYKKLLTPLTKLPAAFERLKLIHRTLGWLEADGFASQYGLIDINDSGLENETQIDKIYCKELQAVVRRDNQLWYDADIVGKFDNAGKVLIQLHEEIYALGKAQDKIHHQVPSPDAHWTSANTRRLVVKMIDNGMDFALLNEHLKTHGFPILYFERAPHIPTPVGYFMDTESCIREQEFLKNRFGNNAYPDWLDTERMVSERYLYSGAHGYPIPQLQNNFPRALSDMISLTIAGNTSTFRAEFMQLKAIFERPESCEGRF